MQERNEILRNYAGFVAKMWEDERIFDELKDNPRTVLSAHGLHVPEDAEINLIVREMKVDGSPTTQADMWEKGVETGVYDIIVPLKPEGLESLEDIPLSEEVLEIVAGGSEMAGCCCPCTCCPCCSAAAQQLQ